MEMKISLVHNRHMYRTALYIMNTNRYLQHTASPTYSALQCTVCYVCRSSIDLYACKRLHTRIDFDYFYPSYDLYDWFGTIN